MGPKRCPEEERWREETVGSRSDGFCSVASFCSEFLFGWQQRNEWLRDRWNLEAAEERRPFYRERTALDIKLLYLKREIDCLISQDTSLLNQLLQLHEAIEGLRQKMNNEVCYPSDDSSETSSLSSEHETSNSPSSDSFPASNISFTSSNNKIMQRRSLIHHTSFVRQRISYPPTARNRYPRVKGGPSHQSQSSYDSGIHTPDQEIFV